MSLRYAIMGILADRPVHGYELRSHFERELAPDDKLNVGQVYATLERLHRDGFVGQRLVLQSERPDKKVYQLTESGSEALRAWFETPTPLDLDLRNETYLKLMTARRVGWANPAQVIAVERRACMERLHELNQARIASEDQAVPIQTRVLLELALLRCEAFVKWLDRCEEIMREESAP